MVCSRVLEKTLMEFVIIVENNQKTTSQRTSKGGADGMELPDHCKRDDGSGKQSCPNKAG